MEKDRNYKRVYVNIDLDAVKYNIKNVQEKLGKDTKVMAVIKADGYGHGALPIAHALSKTGVDGFAVAIAEEGMMLRKGGIIEPILILGYSHPSQYQTIIDYNLTPAIFTYETAKGISDVARAAGQTVKIHIKVETGMNRIGFLPNEESIDIVEKISRLANLELEGIFTHFAKADEFDKTSAAKQMERYLYFVNKLEERGIHIPVKHVGNSATIIDLEQYRFNMVRSGIITYGLYPSDEVEKDALDLKPAMEWKTHIVNLKEIAPGEGVSYGHTFIAEEKRRIATLTVGYADGYPRSLSGKGRVLIRGQYAPIVGRVCMDQMMVDVTDIPEAELLDEVTLMGKDGDNEITAEELAGLTGTINYELVCGISRRVPHVIYEDGKITEVIDYLTDTLTVINR